jgi:hypothetical protein
VLFGIVGVNRGIVYSPNPCLADEITWAETSQAGQAQLYANTADPGPTVSSFWPASNTSAGGQTCTYTYTSSPEANSDGCNYIYGWNAAADSFETAVNAYQSLTYADPAATAASATWWLDVEIANSWQTDTSRNVWALRGAVAFLESAGVNARDIGFYSTASMWQTITGGDTLTFKANLNWVPGAVTKRAAQRNCAGSGFTGGTIVLTQYQSGGYAAALAAGEALSEELPVASAPPTTRTTTTTTMTRRTTCNLRMASPREEAVLGPGVRVEAVAGAMGPGDGRAVGDRRDGDVQPDVR